MKTTIAALCIFLFFIMTLLLLYQIGGTGGTLKGGYLMMTNYYSSNFGDRPISFILEDKDKRGSYSATILVQDARSMRFFKARLGEDHVQSYGQNTWVVQAVSMQEFFVYLRGMEIGILATGSVLIASIILPFYFDSKKS